MVVIVVHLGDLLIEVVPVGVSSFTWSAFHVGWRTVDHLVVEQIQIASFVVEVVEIHSVRLGVLRDDLLSEV